MFAKSLKDFFKNPIIAVPNLVYMLIYKIFFDWFTVKSGLNSPSLENELANAADIQKYATYIAIFLLVLIIMLFLSALIYSWSSTMCKYAVDGQPVNIFSALKESLKYYWRLFGVIILLGAIFISISIVFIIACIPMAMSMQQSDNLKVIFIFIAWLLVFILGIIFLSVSFTPIQILLVYDDLGLGQAISKGFKFGLKKFFHIFGVFLLLVAVGILFSIPLMLSNNNQILSYISSIISTYLGMFIIVYVMNLYKESNRSVPEAENSNNTYIDNTDEESNQNENDSNVDKIFNNLSDEDNKSENNENPPEDKSNFII